MSAWEEEWWYGGMKCGKDGVKDTVTQKQKDALFPQTTFPLLFPFFSLFQTLSFPDSLLLCHNLLTITHSTLFSSTTHVHVHNEHKPKTNTTYNSFHCVCLIFKLSFVTSFFNRTSSFVHHSAHTMRHASNNIHV